MDMRQVSIAAILTSGLICCHTFAAKAQEPQTALAHIKYEFVHLDDTNFRDNPRKEEMMLYIGQDAVMYNSFTLAATLEKLKEDMEKRTGIAAGNTGQRNGTGQSSVFINAPNMSNETLYLFPEAGKAFVVNRLGTTTYIIPHRFPNIEWQINEAVREIGGYSCQQATGTFGGRQYTAWFTTELPFPYGPWKLQGLPGLILEAEDSTGEVMFRYAGFDIQEGSGIEIALPEDAVTTTAKDFAKAKAAFDKNPMANALRNAETPRGANTQRKMVLKDQSGRELSPEEFNAIREMAMKEGKIKQLNNPLELEDK